MSRSTTPVPDRIIHRNSLDSVVRAGKHKGRHLVPLPDAAPSPRLLVLRSYTTLEKADDAQSLIYLGLAPPAADP